MCLALKSTDNIRYVHGENGSHGIQRGNEDSDFTNPDCQQQSPSGLPIGFAMTKNLRQGEKMFMRFSSWASKNWNETLALSEQRLS